MDRRTFAATISTFSLAGCSDLVSGYGSNSPDQSETSIQIDRISVGNFTEAPISGQVVVFEKSESIFQNDFSFESYSGDEYKPEIDADSPISVFAETGSVKRLFTVQDSSIIGLTLNLNGDDIGMTVEYSGEEN